MEESQLKIEKNEEGKLELVIENDDQAKAIAELAMQPVLEECDPNASEGEQIAFAMKTAPYFDVAGPDGQVFLRIDRQGMTLNGERVESHLFLEAWREAMGSVHEAYTNLRRSEERRRGPDHRTLLKRYVQNFAAIYNITGLESDDTALMRDGGFSAEEREELRAIGGEGKAEAPPDTPNTTTVVEIPQKPSLFESLLSRFKRP